MSQWSSLFAEQALGVNKVLGDLLGPCAFALCMAFTRMMYGLHGEKVAVDRALALSAALCIVCYLTAVLSTIPFLALIGCALCGVSVGLMWPGTVSATARRFPLGGTAMFGLLAISGDIGCSVGPWLTGVVSDAMQSSAWGRFPDGTAFALRGTARAEGWLAGGGGFPSAAVGMRSDTRAAKSRLTRQKASLPARNRLSLSAPRWAGTKAHLRAYHGSGKLWRPPRACVWPRQEGCACGIPRENVNCANCWAFC